MQLLRVYLLGWEGRNRRTRNLPTAHHQGPAHWRPLGPSEGWVALCSAALPVASLTPRLGPWMEGLWGMAEP